LTGVGALAGVPVIVASTTAVVGGVGNVMAGINALATTGSGSGQQGATAEPKGGTYQLKDPKTGKIMRTGRTNDLSRRQAEHDRDPATKGLDFEVDRRTDAYAEQRGREQLLHEQHNPPLNKINPVSPKNAARQSYLDAAKKLE
jgi:hypothetical protein